MFNGRFCVAAVRPLVDEDAVDVQHLQSSASPGLSSAAPLGSSWSTSGSTGSPDVPVTTADPASLWSDPASSASPDPMDAYASASSTADVSVGYVGLSAGPELESDMGDEGDLVSSKIPRSVPYTLGPTASTASNVVLCAPGAYCAPLTQCRTILDLLDRTCLAGDK